MKNNQLIHLFGYASGIAAGDPGCGEGPSYLQRTNVLGELSTLQIQWHDLFFPSSTKFSILEKVIDLCERLARNGTAGYGISIDLDAIDPAEAPGVGLAELGGISGLALCDALLTVVDDPQLIGAEIVEYNPHYDIQHTTSNLILKLISAIST